MPPRLSVVIASVNGQPWITECLARLEQQTVRDTLEVIVCDRCRDNTAEAIRRQFPWVQIESGLYEHSIPALRWHGIRRARAPIVAVIEDHSMAPPEWAARVIEAHLGPEGVIAGPVENDSQRGLFDWAFFLIEYAAVMPPMTAGPATVLPSGNLSFKRNILPADERFANLWENTLLDTLRAEGIETSLDPRMVILHKNPFTVGEFVEQRYWFSRSIAALRVRGAGLGRRLLYAAGALLGLPLLLPFRLSHTVWAKGRNRRELMLGLPMIFGFMLCGILGEAAGFLLGDGGSLRRVR